MIENGYQWRVREYADAAREVQQATPLDDPVALAYAEGVEDILRFLVGDAEPTDRVRAIVDHESLS